MAAPAYDKRDLPARLHPAQLRDEPTENGESCGYCQGYPSEVKEGWFQVEYATGSDYSGSSVTRSNYRVLCAMLEEHETGAVTWVRTPGGHGTYGIAVRYFELSEPMREAIDALEDYCVLDDSDLSELELEEQSECWERWTRRDFIRELAKSLGKDSDALGEAITDEQWYSVFHALCEESNTYWEDQCGEGPWIDLKRVVKAYSPGVKLRYPSVDEAEALNALSAALPGVEAS